MVWPSVHNFPADGDYVFTIELHPSPTGQLFGMYAKNEQLEISVNGERKALLDVNPRMSESDPNGMKMETPPIAIEAGPQRIAAAFIQHFEGPVDDLIEPIEHTLADTQIGTSQGITTLPHLRDLVITGPRNITGISDTPSRDRIFVCHPSSAADERPCATTIVKTLARQAYRRPVTQADVDALLNFYDAARTSGDFEDGVRTAVQAMLASPDFVFRLERTPADVKPNEVYRIGDVELASRLSYFLWARRPTKNCSTQPSTTRCATRRCSTAKCSACSPTRGPTRCPPVSPPNGCACRTCRTCSPTRSSIRTTTGGSARP